MTARIARAQGVVIPLVLALLTGCDLREADSAGLDADTPWWVAEGVAPPVHIDSVFPIEVALERFRTGEVEPTELTGGAESPEALLDRFIGSLTAGDASSLASLSLTRAEFAWFYYPHSIYTRPPYELSPELVWMQQQNYGSRGLTRLLERIGGRELFYSGFECPVPEGAPYGEGRIWDGCLVIGALPSGERSEERLFGSILEVGGRYKFVSFTNEL